MATKKPTQAMFFDENEEQAEQEQPKQTRKRAPAKKEEVPEKPVLDSGTHNIIQLPSKGVLGYPEHVEYRDILVKDEEVLSLATPENYARTLNSVIKNILNGCEFFEEMTIFDRDYVMVWLWANNYNPVKEVEVECQGCRNKEIHRVDLTEVDVSDIKEDIPQPFVLPLRNSKMSSVSVRLNTVGDEMEVESFLQKNPKTNFETLMLSASLDLGYDVPLAQKYKWVKENITGQEMGYIRQFHRYFKYGVSDTVEHNCSECSEVTRGRLPFQAEDILFPTVQGDFEELLRSMQDNEDQPK